MNNMKNMNNKFGYSSPKEIGRMHQNHKRIYSALGAAILAIAAGSAMAVDNQPINTTHLQSTAQIASHSLDLQPGDEQLIPREHMF